MSLLVRPAWCCLPRFGPSRAHDISVVTRFFFYVTSTFVLSYLVSCSTPIFRRQLRPWLTGSCRGLLLLTTQLLLRLHLNHICSLLLLAMLSRIIGCLILHRSSGVTSLAGSCAPWIASSYGCLSCTFLPALIL